LHRPFSAWLRQVAANQIADYYRSRSQSHFSQKFTNQAEYAPESCEDNGHRIDDQDILVKVTKTLAGMDSYCQLLLQMAADEFRPREMAIALRWPHSRAKKISDDLRYCRRKLVVLLKGQGIREELTL
jgi:DNA-directed RNA polymerase specialized sigma24 family protein